MVYARRINAFSHGIHYTHAQTDSPESVNYLIQEEDPEEEFEEELEEGPEEDPEEDPEENLEENLEEDLEEDLDDDPKEEVWEDNMEVSEASSNIYDPIDREVCGLDESPKYHPKPYYDGNDDDDDAPT
ncbi:uncharacterized protein [Solanum lycopersicum]|uniref:uncharacterized protein n=1 Tax=Solanum lycopersicum TaxID=4081 RepID=UPI0037497BD3